MAPYFFHRPNCIGCWTVLTIVLPANSVRWICNEVVIKDPATPWTLKTCTKRLNWTEINQFGCVYSERVELNCDSCKCSWFQSGFFYFCRFVYAFSCAALWSNSTNISKIAKRLMKLTFWTTLYAHMHHVRKKRVRYFQHIFDKP